jgi:hypothetical protein
MTAPHQAEQLTSEMFPTFPLCWATLNESQTEDALDELADWVLWAIERYSLDRRVVPECWDNHGGLIEELSALRTAWIAAYCITAPPGAPLEWHQHFDAARQRLSDWSARTGCRPGQHRPVDR